MLGKNYMNFYDTPLDIAYFYNNTPLGINYESKKISWKLHDDVIAYQAFLDAKNELKSYAKLQDYIDTANLTASSKRTNLALSESKKYL